MEEQRRAEQSMDFNKSESSGLLNQSDNNAKKINSSPFVRSEKKVGRNDPCPCGSGKKYKHCCGKLN